MSYHQLKKLISTLLLVAVLVLPLSLTAVTVFGASKTSSSVKKATKKASKKTSKKVSKKCDPNYSGCVPVAKDVDCKPGKGDGPAYLSTPVRVLKKDIYRLDSDHDGIACERN